MTIFIILGVVLWLSICITVIALAVAAKRGDAAADDCDPEPPSSSPDPHMSSRNPG